MADQRAQWNEEAVGANHPTKADVVNRLALVDHNTDGTHKAGVIGGTQLAAAAVTAAKVGTLPGCRVFNSAGLSIPNAAWTTLTFDSEAEDADAMHDPVTNNSRITIKTAGVYLIGGQVYWTANGTGDRLVRILLNGATALAHDARLAASVSSFTAHSISVRRRFSVNDYVEIQAFQSSGAALNIQVVGAGSPYFEAQFIGG